MSSRSSPSEGGNIGGPQRLPAVGRLRVRQPAAGTRVPVSFLRSTSTYSTVGTVLESSKFKFRFRVTLDDQKKDFDVKLKFSLDVCRCISCPRSSCLRFLVRVVFAI